MAAGLAELGVTQRLVVRDLAGSVASGCRGRGRGQLCRRRRDAARPRGYRHPLLRLRARGPPPRRPPPRRRRRRGAGVERIVYVLREGHANTVFTFGRDHFHTEEHIKASPLRWTFMRDNFYLDFMPLFVGEDGTIRGPAARQSGPPWWRATSRPRRGRALRRRPRRRGLRRGDRPRGAHLDEVAEQVARAAGRPVTYVPETLEEARVAGTQRCAGLGDRGLGHLIRLDRGRRAGADQPRRRAAHRPRPDLALRIPARQPGQLPAPQALAAATIAATSATSEVGSRKASPSAGNTPSSPYSRASWRWCSAPERRGRGRPPPPARRASRARRRGRSRHRARPRTARWPARASAAGSTSSAAIPSRAARKRFSSMTSWASTGAPRLPARPSPRCARAPGSGGDRADLGHAVWASATRTSTVPKRGCSRTSDQTNVGSGKARRAAARRRRST